MSKKEIRALEKQQKKEAAFRKIKAQENSPSGHFSATSIAPPILQPK